MNKRISSIPVLAIIIVFTFLIGGLVILVGCLTRKQPVDFYSFEEFEQRDETANWRIYTSEYYGIEIKYPRGWSVIESEEYDNYIMLINSGISSERIMILKSSGPSSKTTGMEILETKDIVVDGIAVKKELFKDNLKNQYYLRVFVPEKSLFCQADYKGNFFEEFSLMYDKILSTLKFIN